MVAPDQSDPDALALVARPMVPWITGPLLHLLRLAALCAGAFAAYATPQASKALAKTTSPAPALRIQSARKEAMRLSKLPPLQVPHIKHPPIDHSGRKEIGKASFYSRRFDGKRTATGQRFNPNTNTAASKSLPIGTTAKVINLRTNKAATVTVNDRGPYVAGRMLDVTPKVAGKLDMKHTGVASVVVAPITVPQPNGTVKLGAGAASTPPKRIRAAVRTTKHVAARVKKRTRGPLIHRRRKVYRNVRAKPHQARRWARAKSRSH
jgi:rare lipoprotein A